MITADFMIALFYHIDKQMPNAPTQGAPCSIYLAERVRRNTYSLQCAALPA